MSDNLFEWGSILARGDHLVAKTFNSGEWLTQASDKKSNRHAVLCAESKCRFLIPVQLNSYQLPTTCTVVTANNLLSR